MITDEEIDRMLDEPLDDEEMADPIEMRQLELLGAIAQRLEQAVAGLQAVVQELSNVAQINAAPREITSVGRDGTQMKAVSKIRGS